MAAASAKVARRMPFSPALRPGDSVACLNPAQTTMIVISKKLILLEEVGNRERSTLPGRAALGSRGKA
jgi:hypothetical protein